MSPQLERILTIVSFLIAGTVLAINGNETLAAGAFGAASGVAMPSRAPAGTAAILAGAGAATAAAMGAA